MRTCSKCGVTLADQAQYCMQCGTPFEMSKASEATGQGDFIQPAMIGGAALGILSSLPIVNAGNCFCCLWIIGGGALGAWLLARQHPDGPEAVSYGDGAFVGVLSGVFGAFVATLASIPVRLLTASALRSQQATFEELLAEAEVEASMRDFLLSMLSPDFTFTTILFTFFINILVFSLFAMIGGILYVAITGKKAGPAATEVNIEK